jgi:DNA replication and repair protein RecF
MKLSGLKLQNFRNHTKREWKFESKTVVVGENGSGKSNMLEAIYMLATGKSYRADLESEIATYESNFFTIIGQIGEIGEIKVIWENGKKRFEINGVARRMIDVVGKFRAVLFGPEDMELIIGSPSVRRRYLDFVISQADREYRRCLISYEKGLRQRNKLLERIRDGFAQRNQLFFWDRLLIKDGEYLTRKREEYLDRMNNSQGKMYNAVYDKSVISEARLKQYEMEEVAAAVTLVGPHRDDFNVEQMTGKAEECKDVAVFGSRGEQRMAVMWLKSGELEYLMTGNEMPMLLLDDIFSELDHKRRSEVEGEVEKLVNKGGQVVMTTADEHMLPGFTDLQLIRL